MRYCPKCKKNRNLCEFYKNKAHPSGVIAYCKPCWNSYLTTRRSIAGSKAYAVQARAVRKYRKQNPNKMAEAVASWKERNPQKYLAHRLVTKAIVAGTLKREKCEFCGTVKTDAHHDDYNRPLSVRWLCRYHHRQIH